MSSETRKRDRIAANIAAQNQAALRRAEKIGARRRSAAQDAATTAARASTVSEALGALRSLGVSPYTHPAEDSHELLHMVISESAHDAVRWEVARAIARVDGRSMTALADALWPLVLEHISAEPVAEAREGDPYADSVRRDLEDAECILNRILPEWPRSPERVDALLPILSKVTCSPRSHERVWAMRLLLRVADPRRRLSIACHELRSKQSGPERDLAAGEVAAICANWAANGNAEAVGAVVDEFFSFPAQFSLHWHHSFYETGRRTLLELLRRVGKTVAEADLVRCSQLSDCVFVVYAGPDDPTQEEVGTRLGDVRAVAGQLLERGTAIGGTS